MTNVDREITREDIREFFKTNTLRSDVEIRVLKLKEQMPQLSTLEALEMLLDWQDFTSVANQ